MKRKITILASAIIIIVACAPVLAACTKDKPTPNGIHASIRTIDDISIAMGREHIYPEEGTMKYHINTNEDPGRFPEKLQYLDFLSSLSIDYEYPNAAMCRLHISKNSNSIFDQSIAYDTLHIENKNISNTIELKENNKLTENGKEYTIVSEFAFNNVLYMYWVTFSQSDDGTINEQEALAARLWIREQIKGYKLYEE